MHLAPGRSPLSSLEMVNSGYCGQRLQKSYSVTEADPHTAYWTADGLSTSSEVEVLTTGDL